MTNPPHRKGGPDLDGFVGWDPDPPPEPRMRGRSRPLGNRVDYMENKGQRAKHPATLAARLSRLEEYMARGERR